MSTELPDVPRRSKELLQSWVDEFREQGHSIASDLNVAFQDGSEGSDTGLVIVHLTNEVMDVYMQPRGLDDQRWEATVTTRFEDMTLSPHHLAGLAAELVIAGNLCTFLQFKSLDWDRDSGLRDIPHEPA